VNPEVYRGDLNPTGTHVGDASELVAVAVIGSDRPGIVSGVTRVLYELGCNLEDASCTILRSHFAMMLLVSTHDVRAAELEEALRPVAAQLDVVITARTVDKEAMDIPTPTHTISVYGTDKPGIVYRVAETLTQAGANIVDLVSRVIGEPERPVYMLVLDVAVPSGDDVREPLTRLGSELGVEISVQGVEVDVL
jgi:glycine cleavage system transcriptional repressor